MLCLNFFSPNDEDDISLLLSFPESKTSFKQDFNQQKLIGILFFHLL